MIPQTFRPLRVLILRPRGLGDVVLASAVLDALKRAWPEASLAFLSSTPSGPLLIPDPRLDRVFLLGGVSSGGEDRAARLQGGDMKAAIRWVRAGEYDLLLDLFSNPRTAVLSMLSGARYRVGLDRGVRRFAYNIRIPRFRGSPSEDDRYAGETLLDFLRQAGIEWSGEARAGVALERKDREEAREVLRTAGFASGELPTMILPAGSWAAKRWTVAGFAGVAAGLARVTGQPSLVLWGPPEERDARAIVAAAPKGTAVLSPGTSLRVMAALLGMAKVVVAPDCLGRHMAIVQGTPTVGVFGDTAPQGWTPRNGPHKTVDARPEAGGTGLKDLPPEPVIRAAIELLTKAGVDSPQGDC
ncbi:MAG: glycosyltransferase family 9 protein [Gemmatimonadota bacterium]|jgi:ADP-heptose:LPS heptosyltransferase|nr:hypothetical protein [Gemmatimonadota bacterium]MDP6460380.1 glycosyltransferase family 9 protein [Gemmatimonadota bacterium]MDP6529026.1 glycosyltransferase family 9 protein [Gemmatimonadota bacterium]MDP6803228.1 glycosyltransferase family 9 protein [Gemmatimonadota bacterium]MDP7032693.1 glycosyltransferase family 9 protein [Gemmatimonadota bacterium]